MRLTGDQLAQSKTEFRVTLLPRIILAGSGVWVTCYVPERYKASKLRLDFEGMGGMETPGAPPIQTRRLFEGVPCGTWNVTCAILTAEGRLQRSERLEVKGECNDGSGALSLHNVQ